jgi:hypothetical protein
MGARSRLHATDTEGLPALWLGHIPNRFDLKVPSRAFQRAIIRYDKMLRLFPSQVEPVYRLVRLCRAEARLGLNVMKDLHTHPDTVVCINEGVLPISELLPWAVDAPERVIRDLRARDTWLHGGKDAADAPDKLIALMEENSRREQAHQRAEADGDFDERASTAFRWLRYGPPAWSKNPAPAESPEADFKLAPLPDISLASRDNRDPGHTTIQATYGLDLAEGAERTVAVVHDVDGPLQP